MILAGYWNEFFNYNVHMSCTTQCKTRILKVYFLLTHKTNEFKNMIWKILIVRIDFFHSVQSNKFIFSPIMNFNLSFIYKCSYTLFVLISMRIDASSFKLFQKVEIFKCLIFFYKWNQYDFFFFQFQAYKY